MVELVKDNGDLATVLVAAAEIAGEVRFIKKSGAKTIGALAYGNCRLGNAFMATERCSFSAKLGLI
jgi:histidinol dehydrogenase